MLEIMTALDLIEYLLPLDIHPLLHILKEFMNNLFELSPDVLRIEGINLFDALIIILE